MRQSFAFVALLVACPRPTPPAPAAPVPAPPPPETITMGALEKAQIDTVIRQNLPKIRYCYQRALSDQPSLQGELTIGFTIAKDGHVVDPEVRRTTLNEPTVEACVVDRFRPMVFPEPKGGGIVKVTYPFVFQP